MYILVVDKLVLRQKQINSMDTKYFEYFIVAILTTIIFFFWVYPIQKKVSKIIIHTISSILKGKPEEILQNKRTLYCILSVKQQKHSTE